MDERQAYRVVVLGAKAQVTGDLRVILQGHGGPRRFVVVSALCAAELDRRACELLMVDLDGQANPRWELLAECRDLYPDLPVIVLVERGDIATAVAALKAGAANCLEQPLETQRVLSAVTEALDKGPSSGPPGQGSLTSTEIQVLRLLLSGRTNLQIAEQFHRSPRTVESHRRNIMRKLGASSAADLVREAVNLGLIGREPWGPALGGDERRPLVFF